MVRLWAFNRVRAGSNGAVHPAASVITSYSIHYTKLYEYSRDNIIRGNSATRGRYSLHFMYSQYNLVENNRFYNNSVGIFLMYSDGVKVRGNLITNATGATGVGIGFKETSDVVITSYSIHYTKLYDPRGA